MTTNSHLSKQGKTGCCVVGGGPGGMFLALLLARQGVEVTLLEAHLDFDRDFRGDTIHPSTLELLEQLGLARDLLRLPHGKLRRFTVHTPGGQYTLADLARLPTRYPYVMLLPQVELLEFLAQHAGRYPNLTIEMGAQVTGLVRDREQVCGVRYHKDGVEHELRAILTVAADGRFSKLRKVLGLEPIRTSPPMDVVWFRLPRHPGDPSDQGLSADRGRFLVLLERGDQWQIGFVIPKGGYQQFRAQGIDAFHREVLSLLPWLADRIGQLRDWHTVTLLSVESNRLQKWYVPGLLLIGDAAHAMSPVGGVGINYAVQDAVAAANCLADPLRRGVVTERDLHAVQQRREWPVRMIQVIQGFMQRKLVAEALDRGKPFELPMMMRILLRVPILRDLPGRVMGMGFGRDRLRRARPGV